MTENTDDLSMKSLESYKRYLGRMYAKAKSKQESDFYKDLYNECEHTIRELVRKGHKCKSKPYFIE